MTDGKQAGEVAKQASGLASSVPQIFYDVIARLTPGAAVVVVGVVAVAGPGKAWSSLRTNHSGWASSYLTGSLLLILAIVGFYTAAVLLRGWLAFVSEFLPFAWSNGRKGLVQLAETSKSKEYDYIKLVHPVAGNRIAKLHSEIHMTQVVGVGLVFAALASWISPFYETLQKLQLSACLVVGVCSCAGMWLHLIVRRNSSIQNHAELLGFDDDVVVTGLLPDMSKKDD